MKSNQRLIIIILAVSVVALAALAGYSYNNSRVFESKVGELERRLSVLQGESDIGIQAQSKIDELQKKVDFMNEEKKNLVPVIDLATGMAKACTGGNLDKIEPMLDKSLIVIKSNSKIYLVRDGKLKEKYLLYDTDQRLQIDELTLMSYEKVDKNSYFVELRQSFLNESGEEHSQYGYLDLKIVDVEGNLKIKDARLTLKKN